MILRAQLIHYQINGNIYKLGDTITISKGTGINCTYLNIQEKIGMPNMAYAASKNSNEFTVGPECANTKVVIIDIGIIDYKKELKPYFVVSRGRFKRYYVFIEQALISGEIK